MSDLNKIIHLSRPDIRKDDMNEVARVLKSGMLVQGKEVKKLEEEISGYIGTDFCSAVSNGTASLQLALIAAGIGPGDGVIVPAFSFVATANVVELVGARPVFVDIDPRYFNIDESKIEQVITKRTKAIIPVHEFGLCANMVQIMSIAKKRSLLVIEDAACALGATLNSKHAGSFGDFGSFSLHPRKAVTSGEGGLLLTSDVNHDSKIKTLRNHGINHGSQFIDVTCAGFNYRLTDFQAALVRSQFSRLESILKYKSKLASVYFEEIKNNIVRLPEVYKGARHTWQTFHILLENRKKRDQLINYLKENGVMSNYGAQCIPAMTYYQNKYNHNYKDEFPNSYEAYSCGLAIPMHTQISTGQVKFISNLINKFK